MKHPLQQLLAELEDSKIRFMEGLRELEVPEDDAYLVYVEDKINTVIKEINLGSMTIR
jgi:hypothetical protein